MEGERYNLGKAQEEAEKLKQKVESGEASDYSEAEKNIDRESGLRQKVKDIIKQRGFYAKTLYEEIDLPKNQLNKLLVEIWLSGEESYEMRNFFDYVGEHKEDFTDISLLPEGETPYPIKSLFEDAVKNKKDISKIVSLLKDVLQINDQQLESIVADTYQYYAGNKYQTTVFQALQSEFPLSPEQAERIASSYIKTHLKYAIQDFSRGKSHSHFRDEDFLLALEEFGTPTSLLNDPTIIQLGRDLTKTVLLWSTKQRKITELEKLHDFAPQFFEGDFSLEVKQFCQGIIEYGAVEQAEQVFTLFNSPMEEVKPILHESIVKRLNNSEWYPSKLIPLIEKLNLDEILTNTEVKDAALTARRNALGVLLEEEFIKISEKFGYSTNWKKDPDLVDAVKKGILYRTRKGDIWDAKKLSNIFGNFGIEQVLEDDGLKLELQERILDREWNSFHWEDKLDAFNKWGLSIDQLREKAKQALLNSLKDKEYSFLNSYNLDYQSLIKTFPEIFRSQEVQEIAIRRILETEYGKESYGYHNLERTIEQIDKEIKALGLQTELLEQWKANLATKLLADVKDQKQLKEFQEAQRYLKISPDVLKSVAIDSSLISLSKGEISNSVFLEKQFAITFAEVDVEKLKQSGEAGIQIALQQGNLGNAIQIQETCKLPPSFFENIEVYSKVAELFAPNLLKGDVGNVLEKAKSFHLQQEGFWIIDDIANSGNILETDLIKFIQFLGNEEFIKYFPNTSNKVREMIFAKLATDQDLADYFVENLDKYFQQPWVAENVAKAIQQYSVAQKFIYAVENDQTTWKNETWVVDVFAKAKVIVEEHQKQFDQDDDGQDSYGYSHGNEGFSESDPFANHPWRFGGRQIRIASAISELMAGKTNAQGLKELGINSEEISPLLAEANEKVNTAYQNFLEQIRSNTSIKDDDKQALLNPESSSVKMTALLDNIRSFVARYFVQSVEGDVTRLLEIGNLGNDLDRILAEGFRRYIKIHEVDVPLYDKLYEEFDTLRETGRSPLEVYLGRDGIYAYIGRHSQDVARRRKLGLEGRKKLKEMGEVVEIHPQYTVYPRYFRDNLNQETKRQFLEQEGISPDADPLFYDTGYTGTIPEQIMKVMDFSQEDIERRIRLLSAPSVHRRVKGIPENARSEIIEYIEHNAKTEETAEGLIIDEKTGKIRHIARPTNPEEQFYFMMVKQAVARHYWLQEQLHHEPSGNVNLDSEHYTIRIRQEYAKLLPPDFMQNPKEFLTQHGEMLKGSKGEGEYPDEEVVLFKMTDGTEIVAKKIELRKAKEARKEFSILISAKKAGLPTAEPVGFLSGKEDTDGSYLLMKKIEGISGRNFDKYLRDTGKFTEEKIKSILQQVAQKNKEMAELFRTTLKIDKRWRIKDTIIELNEETGEVENVVPIDWERAQNFNPATPKEIDEIA